MTNLCDLSSWRIRWPPTRTWTDNLYDCGLPRQLLTKRRFILEVREESVESLWYISQQFFITGGRLDTFSREIIVNIDVAPFRKGVYSKRKAFVPNGSKCFPFRVDPFSETVWCTGKQTGIHKSCSPCQNTVKYLPSVFIHLNTFVPSVP